MGWSDLPKGQRLAIVIAVPVILVGVFIYLARNELIILGKDPVVYPWASVLYPADKQLGRSKYKLIEDKERERKQFEKKAEELPELMAKLQELEGQRLQLRSLLPADKEKTQVRVQLQDMLKELTGENALGRIEFGEVSISEVAPQGGSRRSATASGSAAEELVYKLRFKADMNGLIYYINRVENSQRFMAVSQLSITPGLPKVNREKAEIEYPLHDIALEIKTYVYSENG